MKKEPAKVTVPHRDLEPNYYCVKTTYHHNGKIESEILTEENSEMLIAFESPGKPLDGVFETATATIYYTYHDSYEEAARQIEATGVYNKQLEQVTSMISFTQLLSPPTGSLSCAGSHIRTEVFRLYMWIRGNIFRSLIPL